MFFFSFVAALAVSAMAVYTNRNLYTSRAGVISDANISFSVKQSSYVASTQIGSPQDQQVALTLTPIGTGNSKISGFNIVLNATNIQILDVIPTPVGIFTEVARNFSNVASARVSYATKVKDNMQLPAMVTLGITFKGLAAGQGTISIDPSSQIVGVGVTNGEEWRINTSNVRPATINFTPAPGQPAVPPGTQPQPVVPVPVEPQPKPPASKETQPKIYCSQTSDIPFKDISATDTELKKILSCFSSTPASACIVNGYPEYSCQSFNPKLPSPCFAKDRPITKAEAISFISRYHSMIQRDNNWTMVFANQAIPNTEQSYWAYQDIVAAYKNGFQTIIDANFKPEDPWLYGFKGIEGSNYSPSATGGTMTRGDFITKLYNFAVNEDKKVVFTCGTTMQPPSTVVPPQEKLPAPPPVNLPPGSEQVCLTVITYAISPQGVCQQFPSSCIPAGWTHVPACPAQQPGQNQGNLASGSINLMLRLPDVSPSVNVIEAFRFRIEVYENLGGGSIASPVSPVQLIRQGDFFRTSAPLTFNLPADKPYIIIIKGDNFIKRVFNNVYLRRGMVLDCSLNAGECGELTSQRDFKLFFGGDADGFNTLSGSYNRVDSADLTILANYFNRNTPSTADFNMDGKVDIADLEILGRNYTKQGD